MVKYEIGRFYATSFNGIVLEFIVYDDKTIDCPTLNLKSFNKIETKPRFVLRGSQSHYIYDVKASKKYTSPQELIASFDIDEALFNYMRYNNMIIYSTDMAYFYGFSNTEGYDSDRGNYGVGSPYKWARKKGPILVKQRNGQFN